MHSSEYIHLIFDFNNVLLFPKRSIPVDLIAMLTKDGAGIFKTIVFSEYFYFNERLFDYLTELKRQQPTLKLTIFTNSTVSIYAPEVTVKLEPLFNQILAAKKLNLPKHIPDSYTQLLDLLDAVPKEHCFFTDDSINNSKAARQAGLETHHYQNDDTALMAAIETFLAKFT